MPALLFLEAVAKGEAVRLGRKVAVIGGGNAAIDSARTALRMGSDVTVIYRRERKDMPAIREETDAAEAEGAKFLFLADAAPHRRRRRGQREGHRGGKDQAGRVRSLRPAPPGADRRNPPPGVRHRDPGGGRSGGPGFRPRLRPAHQGSRHARGGPLHARNQPQQILRGRRRDQRRFQRVQRHGLRQEGGAQHRPAADGRVALGPARPAASPTARRRPWKPSASAAPPARRTAGARTRGKLRGSCDRARRRKRRWQRRRAACAATSRITTKETPCRKKSRFGSTANMCPPTRARPSWRWRGRAAKYIPTLCWLENLTPWAPAGSASWRSRAWAACCPPAPRRCRTA